MTSSEPQKSILFRAYQCKSKTKINIQQFLDIINSQIRLSKMNEKGLIILYLAEILFKIYLTQGIRIRNFIVEFDKKDIKKRQRRQGGQHRKRKGVKNQNKRGGTGKTLEQLSNQSLSNPSNVQRPRINVQNRPDQSANQNQVGLASKQKEQQSNGSNNGSKDSKNPLKIQLNKIAEQIRGQQQTFLTDVQFVPPTQFQDNSQTTSTSQSGQISNLSQKIKIFTNTKQNQHRGTTTRRKTGNNNGQQRSRQRNPETRTKKKKYDIIDQSTFIQQTRQTQNQHTVLYTQITRFNTQQVTDLDIQNNFYQNMKKDQANIISQIFKKDKIQQIKNIIQLFLPQNQSGQNIAGNYGDYQNNIMNNNDDQQFPDYTMSQPISAPYNEPQFFKQSLEIKDSQFNFNDLINRSTKDKSTLFYQLLWRQQNDQITLYQSQPENFSMIKIKQK